MAVRVYKFRKPIIDVVLTPGGTLVANTKYYICGFFQRARTYINVTSPFSNIVELTTDSVNKSFTINWKSEIEIQSFSDGGSGKLKVNAINHCITSGNTIIINNGIYAGTYTVNTWLDYNSFLITKQYVSSYSSLMTITTTHNTMNGIIFYVSAQAPFSGDPNLGTWIGTINNFSHYPWNIGFTISPSIISAPCLVLFYGAQVQIQGTLYRPPKWNKVMEKGNIWLDCTGEATVLKIENALIDSDSVDVSYVKNETFLLYGILVSIGTLTLTDLNIINYCGMIGGASTDSQLTFLRCNLQFLQMHYGAYIIGTANYCNFQFLQGSYRNGTVYSFPSGNFNSFNSPNGLGAEGIKADTTVNNMSLSCNNSSWLMDFSKSRLKYINCTVYNGTITIYYFYKILPTDRVIQGCTIFAPSTIDIQFVSSDAGWTNEVHLQNINTTRALNRKVVNYPYFCPAKLFFHRTGRCYILDINKVTISEASVNFVDEYGNNYSYTTNNSGYIDFEILEQISFKTNNTAGIATNVYYEDYNITIEKSGYTSHISKITVKNEIIIILKPIPTPKLFTRILNLFASKSNQTPIAEAAIQLNQTQGQTSELGTAQFSSNRKLVTNADLSIDEMVEVSPGVWQPANLFDELGIVVPLDPPVFIQQNIKATISDPEHITAKINNSQTLKATIS